MKPRAFVLMPFSSEFESVYGLFIGDALTEAGYEVFRADDICSQQNILQDIIDAIVTSDLIIADLTTSNPNVYYELGLAHALKRPVVLLTQDTSELPFDLRSYRVIPYDTDFAQIPKARAELLEVAKLAIAGKLRFGSPVTDFARSLKVRSVKLPEEIASSPSEEKDDDMGFLDHLVQLEDGLGELTQVIKEIGEINKQMAEETTDATDKMNTASKNPSSGTARYLQKVTRKLGEKQLTFADSLAEKNDRYREALGKTSVSLDYVINAQAESKTTDHAQLKQLLDTLNEAETSSTGSREAFGNFLQVLEGLPKTERTFERARKATIREISSHVDNIERTIAMISRARAVGNAILEVATAADGGDSGGD